MLPMPRELLLYLEDMRACAEKVQRYTVGMRFPILWRTTP